MERRIEWLTGSPRKEHPLVEGAACLLLPAATPHVVPHNRPIETARDEAENQVGRKVPKNLPHHARTQDCICGRGWRHKTCNLHIYHLCSGFLCFLSVEIHIKATPVQKSSSSEIARMRNIHQQMMQLPKQVSSTRYPQYISNSPPKS